MYTTISYIIRIPLELIDSVLIVILGLRPDENVRNHKLCRLNTWDK